MADTQFHHPEALVSGDWLEANLSEPDLRVFDCTTYLELDAGPDQPYRIVSGRADYDAGHIPGSGFLDLQGDFSVADSPFRFTLPSPDVAAATFAQQGIGDGARVVLYSRGSAMWATRFWWMLRWLGFDNAAILDGGFDKWAADRRAVSTEPCAYPAGDLTARPRPDLFVGREEMLAAIDAPDSCTINALSPELHSGASPRYGRPGRIPGSVNVPAMSLVNPETKEVAPPETVASAFAAAGADPDKRILAYCGGGIAATYDAFLLHQLGYTDIAVYDNSMSEWATDDSLPIETG